MLTPKSAGRARRHSTLRRRPAPRLMGVALAAARQGQHVFPLWPRSKTPCLHGQRRCDGTGVCRDGHLGWEQRATIDPDMIRYWWGASPRCNVGIACGPSGLYVVDLDPAHGETPPEEWAGVRHGRDVLARLSEQAGEPCPDDTYTVRTPSPGEHLYFSVGENSTLRNTVGLAGWRIDSRGRGGFVVAAGSMRPDGLYTVTRQAPIASLPTWLVPHFTPPPRPDPEPSDIGDIRPLSDVRRRRYLDTVIAGVAEAAPKTAHTTLIRAAYTLGRLVGGGEFTDNEARSALYIAAQDRRIPTYEADQAITDGLAAGARSPRRLGATRPNPGTARRALKRTRTSGHSPLPDQAH